MNKAFVFNQLGSMEIIECSTNAEANNVADAIMNLHESNGVQDRASITILYSDGSYQTKGTQCIADKSIYLRRFQVSAE